MRDRASPSLDGHRLPVEGSYEDRLAIGRQVGLLSHPYADSQTACGFEPSAFLTYRAVVHCCDMVMASGGAQTI